MGQIVSFDELSGIRDRHPGKKIIHCHGTFDLMHPGHIKHFKAAKALGDALVVTVTSDKYVKKGIGRPVFLDMLRAESIAALECVDFVAIIPHESSNEAISAVRPDVFVKGGDYDGKEKEEGHPTWREKHIVESFGGKIHFTHESVTFSSTALLNDHFSPFPEETRNFLRMIKQQYPDGIFKDFFDRTRKVRALVIGDAILDIYHYSSLLGRSIKEEIPRVKVHSSEMFLGGSLAVANTLAGFCDSVGIAAVLGRQDRKKEAVNEQFIRSRLYANVTPHFFFRDEAPTICNERFVDYEAHALSEKAKVPVRKYFGIYSMNEALLLPEFEYQIIQAFEKILSSYDLVVVTDYGLGMFTPLIINLLAEKSPLLSVNTQTNSANMGFNFITKYKRCDYTSISQPEIRLAFHEKHAPVEQLADIVQEKLNARAVSVTLGPFGALLCDSKSKHRIPVFSTNIVDRIGAGDAYFALTSLGLPLNAPLPITGFIGAVAAAISCGSIANKEIADRESLEKSVHSLLTMSSI